MQAKHRVLVTRNTEINLKKVSIVYDFQSTSHKILDGHHEECTLINIPVDRLEPIENEDRFFTNGRYFWHSTVLSSSFMPLEVKKMKQRPPYGSRFFIALSDEGELMIIHTADGEYAVLCAALGGFCRSLYGSRYTGFIRRTADR